MNSDKNLKVNMISESAFTVQGHGVHTAFMESMASLKAAGIDVAPNTDRPADIVHVHTVGPYSLRKLLRGKAKKVISAHVVPESFVGSLLGAKYWFGLAKIYLKWFYNRADGVLAVSEEVVGQLKKLGVSKPIFLVPNTIDTAPFRATLELRAKARKHLGYSEDDFLVICNGQVSPRKRIDTYFACAEKLPEIKFVWVGGIPFKKLAAGFKEMSNLMEHHPDNLRFSGLVSREDVVAYYQAADLFFLPSEQETFGIVVIEGAAAGLPVLLRDLEQYQTTFKGGYMAGQEENFVEIIQRFRDDKEFYDHWQKQAKIIADKYNSEAGAKRLLEVYGAVSKG